MTEVGDILKFILETYSGLILQVYFLKIGEFHSVAHLVLEKVPVLNSTGNIQHEENVTSMKVEFKMSSKVGVHIKECSCDTARGLRV